MFLNVNVLIINILVDLDVRVGIGDPSPVGLVEALRFWMAVSHL